MNRLSINRLDSQNNLVKMKAVTRAYGERDLVSKRLWHKILSET